MSRSSPVDDMPEKAICSLCGGDAFYNRTYSGVNLCKKCFCESIEQTVRKTISKHRMFRSDDRIAVAVSGGKDSVSLLNILAKLERSFPRAELIAITIDEGISGYREEAIGIARESCSRAGVEHRIFAFRQLFGYTLDEITSSPLVERGLSECARCGILRRKALNVAARQLEADKLATAHTLDDEIQTFLLNIAHGNTERIGLTVPFLTGAGERFVTKVKPYWEILESESALYAYATGVHFQAIPCPYRESSMRSEIRRFLNEMEGKHSGIKHVMRSSLERISATIQRPTTREYTTCKECGDPSMKPLCKSCEVLVSLDRARR